MSKLTNDSKQFHDVIENHNIEELKKLIAAGADLNQRFGGVPMLLWAIEYKNCLAIQLLIENNVNINVQAKTNAGYTPLIYAALKGDKTTVQLLLEKGADVNLITNLKASALIYATACNHTEIAELLVENNADPNLLGTPIYGDISIADIHEEDLLYFPTLRKATALAFSTVTNNIELTKLFIRNKADIDLCDEQKVSPLMSAISYKNLDIAKLLIDFEANINHQDIDNTSPLLYAVQTNCYDLTKLLLGMGAEVNIQTNMEQITPLMVAAGHGTKEMVELLLDNRADIHLKNKSGKTALTIAKENNKEDITQLLLEQETKKLDSNGILSNNADAHDDLHEDHLKDSLEEMGKGEIFG